VATVSIGKPGATNAAVLAAQILAVKDEALAERVRAYKQKLADGVDKAAAELKSGGRA
jgi:phosphoribosylcarboxyaminoimidazole (NCAIR) mutase